MAERTASHDHPTPGACPSAEDQERFRLLVECTGVIPWEVDVATFRFTYVGPQAERMLGYPVAKWLEPDFWIEHLHPEDREQAIGTCTAATNRLEDHQFEYRMVHANGSHVWLRDIASVVARDGRPALLRGYMVDITEQKAAEMRLRALFRIAELASNARDLEAFYRSLHAIVAEWMPARNLYVALYDAATDVLTFPYMVDEHMERPPARPLGSGLTDHVVRTRKPVFLPKQQRNSRDDLRSVQTIGREAVDWLGVPLSSGDAVIGVLAVQSYREDERYDESHAELLSFVSRQIASVLLHQQAAEALRLSEERYALAAKGANDGLWDWNLLDESFYVSGRWETMVGFAEGELDHSPREWFSRVHPEDLPELQAALDAHFVGDTPHFQCEYRIRHRDGSWPWMLARGVALRDAGGRAVRMAGSQTDINDRKSQEARLRHDAFHDPLTGMPNRALLRQLLEGLIARAAEHPERQFALLFLDLDGFKAVNDSMGHLVGDQLLVAVSRRLVAALRPEDVVSRFAGDEFALVVDDIQGLEDALRVAERVHLRLESAFILGKTHVNASASIGIAMGRSDYSTPEDLIRDADIALYEAKALGKAKTAVFGVPRG